MSIGELMGGPGHKAKQRKGGNSCQKTMGSRRAGDPAPHVSNLSQEGKPPAAPSDVERLPPESPSLQTQEGRRTGKFSGTRESHEIARARALLVSTVLERNAGERNRPCALESGSDRTPWMARKAPPQSTVWQIASPILNRARLRRMPPQTLLGGAARRPSLPKHPHV